MRMEKMLSNLFLICIFILFLVSMMIIWICDQSFFVMTENYEMC